MLWDRIKKFLRPADNEAPVSQQMAQAIKEIVREKRASDPLIGPTVAGHALAQSLMSGLKDQRGVHIETLLCALGSLAGYSCQASIRESLKKSGQPPHVQGGCGNALVRAELHFFARGRMLLQLRPIEKVSRLHQALAE